ncbi:hypothetical protein OROGR_032935 [Orobanche gracilis]
MDRPVRGRGRGGRGRGRGRVPRPRANTRANTASSSAESGSPSENQSHPSEQQQRQEHVDPYVVMQGMMAQMTQMGQLMETMQRAATAGQQQQQQGQQPPPNGGSVVSRIINDISRQRPPTFEGSSEPADIIHWIDHFEKLFEMVNCLEENRTSVAAYYLGKGAHTWWLATRPTDGVHTWEEFKNRMFDRYYPAPLREAKLSELLNPSTTEDEDVLSIAEKFHALLPFATSIIRSEADKIKYFLKRLKSRMRMQLLNHYCTTLAEFIEKALENELTAKELFKKPSSGVKRSKGQPDDSKGAFKKPKPVQNSSTKAPAAFKSSGSSSRAVSSNPTCHNCGAGGHISPNCPKPHVQCNACGKFGYRARYCSGGSGRALAVSYTPAQPLVRSGLLHLHLIRPRELIREWVVGIKQVHPVL